MTLDQTEFCFLDPGHLVDDDLELFLFKTTPGDPDQGFVPQYEFELRLTDQSVKIGCIRFRVGLTEQLKRFAGNIGYEVDEGYRGHRYAARACRLLFPLATALGLSELWITCSPDNAASRRTCERIGAHYLDTIDVEIEPGRLRPTCRYIVELKQEATGDMACQEQRHGDQRRDSATYA